MGTRRSKHNKGRKPLYKEHRNAFVEAPLAYEPQPIKKLRADPYAAVPRDNTPGGDHAGWIAAYRRRKTGNLMRPGLNYLKDLIVRPGIEHYMKPLTWYRGSMSPGHAHRMWNYVLLMMAAEAETLSDGLTLSLNPAFSQLCGPTKTPSRITLSNFFGRLWDNPEVARNIPGLVDYVKLVNLGPCSLIPVDPESARANVAKWRTSTHEDPHRYPGERGAKVTFYPYVVHDHERPDEGRDLVLLVNRLVPQRIPPDIRADICQDLIVGILSGEVEREDAPDYVERYITEHFRGRDWKWAPTGGVILSADAPIRFDDPEGAKLADVLHDGSYQHWSHEMDGNDEDEDREALRNVLKDEARHNEMAERRKMYRGGVRMPTDAMNPERLLMEKEDGEER